MHGAGFFGIWDTRPKKVYPVGSYRHTHRRHHPITDQDALLSIMRVAFVVMTPDDPQIYEKHGGFRLQDYKNTEIMQENQYVQ
jgi:hypothetical protein